jgi:hypothetical protein
MTMDASPHPAASTNFSFAVADPIAVDPKLVAGLASGITDAITVLAPARELGLPTDLGLPAAAGPPTAAGSTAPGLPAGLSVIGYELANAERHWHPHLQDLHERVDRTATALRAAAAGFADAQRQALAEMQAVQA